MNSNCGCRGASREAIARAKLTCDPLQPQGGLQPTKPSQQPVIPLLGQGRLRIRRIATRYGKIIVSSASLLAVASLMIWMRQMPIQPDTEASFMRILRCPTCRRWRCSQSPA
jgi:hypothetical protein